MSFIAESISQKSGNDHFASTSIVGFTRAEAYDVALSGAARSSLDRANFSPPKRDAFGELLDLDQGDDLNENHDDTVVDNALKSLLATVGSGL